MILGTIPIRRNGMSIMTKDKFDSVHDIWCSYTTFFEEKEGASNREGNLFRDNLGLSVKTSPWFLIGLSYK